MKLIHLSYHIFFIFLSFQNIVCEEFEQDITGESQATPESYSVSIANKFDEAINFYYETFDDSPFLMVL